MEEVYPELVYGIGFDYIVKPKPLPKLAFGTAMDRVTLPLGGPALSPFMRAMQGDVNRSPGPQAYVDERDHMKLDWPSRVGFSGLVNSCRRSMDIVNPNPWLGFYRGKETICHRKIPKKAPFNSTALRGGKPPNAYPAPGIHNPKIKKPDLSVSLAFGGHRRLRPYAKVICTPVDASICSSCEEKPEMDYWHDPKQKLDLCRACMKNFRGILGSFVLSAAARIRLTNFVGGFVRARYCGFFHNHRGTLAATQTLPLHILKHKVRIENNLARYMEI